MLRTKPLVQRLSSCKQIGNEVPHIVSEVLRSPGHPLDPSTRAFFELRFGHDFSKVRIHADSQAAEVARSFQTLAFAIGTDVVFGAGQFAPEIKTGQRLLAHELSHVVQQAKGSASDGRIDKKYESEKTAETIDHDIEELNLSSKARTGAYELKKKHPAIVFTSGRRSVEDQSHAMAKNIVESGDRRWIEKVYTKTSSRQKLQKWVDEHPEAETIDAIANGLEEVFNTMTDKKRTYISKHLTGEAFDVQPVTEDATAIKSDIKALSGLKKFLEKEGGLTIWHAQFMKIPDKRKVTERSEQEADQMAEQVMHMPEPAVQPEPT